MNVAAHREVLEEKKALLESEIEEEIHRPLPNFLRVHELKKRKLRLKEALMRLEHEAEAA